ncbi:HSP-70 cofactor [gamma proteobacterium HdN1]|nr:HSP-70 cofactor [gamma proteobacterium HdN1]
MSEQDNESTVVSEQPDVAIQPEITLETVMEELEQTRSGAANLQDQLLRVSAEMQNLRRRADRDVENARKFALEKFSTDLLPVVDNLERGLQAAGTDEAHIAVREGVELTLRLLMDVLRKHGVEVVDPIGQAFDPALHEAMSMAPSPDHAPNTVMAVLQKGYTLSGRLVRPAMVIVATQAK